ncbi:competence/damage-inducible protein A [Salarchaeum japonicum]|uniref:Competence/damage-inducible protein A n=1 Tax=Salarchaeum japonicum TaxID=555573 RepID=A0AAV3T4F7_9EURY|nr:molybdopterin-binding protein [Salarchaeum japonicum]
MEVALLTVGDELLAGETENTNASWLSRRLTERGATVTRVLVVPDDHDTIASYTREWRERFDAVLVTGGLGGTPDDVTMDAVADAVGRDVVVSDDAKSRVVETAEQFADDNPELVDAYDLDLDFDAWASVPEGARVVPNDAGLAPGAVVESVYVLPGVPAEMKAVFERMAADFGGDVVSETVYTPAPEGALTGRLEDLRDGFDVTVGSYPATDDPNRIKVTGTDSGEVERAAQWVRENVETVDE